jgi:hypothetical protein
MKYQSLFIRRSRLSLLGLVALTACETDSQGERVLKDRQPARVLLYTQQLVTPANKYSGIETRTDSIWLFNGELSDLGGRKFRVWIETEWYNDPPPEFGENPMSDRNLLDVDCDKRLYREGNKVGEVPTESITWSAPQPRTVRRAYLDSLCQYLGSP